MENFFSAEEDENMLYVISIDLSNFNSSSVENMNSLFSGCISLENISLSNFDTTKVINLSKMFNNCKSLKSLDLSTFRTSSVTNMESMFSGCSLLESIDLSNFDTKNVINMSNMFEGCESLNSIDLSKYITDKVENMNSMFAHCTSLKILNLSNFITSSVISMDYMFYNCTSLNILDISNFNMLQTTSAVFILSGLYNLNFINLYNTKDNDLISESILNTNNNIENNFYVCQKNNIITNIKSIPCCNYNMNENQCDDILTTNIINNILTTNLIDDILTTNNLFDTTIIINTTNEIESIYNSIIENIEDLSYKVIQTEIGIFQFSTLEEQVNNKSEKISSVDLGECEDLLREQEGLNSTEQFLIVKLDIKNTTTNATFVQYEIFNPRNFSKISLEVCKNISVKISVPVSLNEEKLSLISSLEEYGYNIFDIKDEFYNDICATYTAQNGADITLSSRKSKIYDPIKEIYLCQEGCEFESFDTTTSKAECSCKIQETNTITDISKISFDKNEFFDSFYSTLFNSNFRVLKCIKLLFSIKGIKTNYGFYLMTGLALCFIGFIIVHIMTGLTKLINIINDILIQKGIKVKEDLRDNKNENNELKNKDGQNNKKKEIEKEIKYVDNKHSKKRHSSKINKIEKKDLKIEELQAPYKKRNSKKHISSKIKRDAKENRNTIKVAELNINTKDEMNKETIEIKETSNNEKDLNQNKEEVYQEKQILEEYKNLKDEELDDLDYEIAIIVDKRTYWQLYLSLIKKNQLIIFTFITNDDYNLRAIKIILFIVSFALFFSINAFFFSDGTMDKIYEDNGMFNFIFQLPQIIYSSLISSVINIILQKLSISENQIFEMKKEKDEEKVKQMANSIKKKLKIKLIIFLVLSSLLMLFFWYFISCFCAAYKNTQDILISDTLISFLTSMIYPFGLELLPGILRIPSLRAPKKDQKYMYKISKILNLL